MDFSKPRVSSTLICLSLFCRYLLSLRLIIPCFLHHWKWPNKNRSIQQANELAYGSVFTIFRPFTTNFTLISLIFEFHDLSVLFCRYLFSLWLVIPVFSASLLEVADQTTDAYHKHVNLVYGYLFTDFQEHDQFYRDLFNLREFMICRTCFIRYSSCDLSSRVSCITGTSGRSNYRCIQQTREWAYGSVFTIFQEHD